MHENLKDFRHARERSSRLRQKPLVFVRAEKRSFSCRLARKRERRGLFCAQNATRNSAPRSATTPRSAGIAARSLKWWRRAIPRNLSGIQIGAIDFYSSLNSVIFSFCLKLTSNLSKTHIPHFYRNLQNLLSI